MEKPHASKDDQRRQIISRLREERLIERFSQEELASEIAISRMALANYEQGVSKLPFAVGLAICRRLDLNPRWLATGEGEKRPYITPDELGLKPEDLQLPPRLVDFLGGYEQVLAKPLHHWEEEHSTDEWVRRMITGGPATLARRMSRKELEQTLITSVCTFVAASEDMKASHLENLLIFAQELKERLATKSARAVSINKS